MGKDAQVSGDSTRRANGGYVKASRLWVKVSE